MDALPDASYQKATQALNFLALKKDGKINKMKAIKLIYLADRLHLRKYGRPIIGDLYWAMKLGPVGERTKHIAELTNIPQGVFAYAKKYIKPCDEKKQSLVSIKEPDLNVFSKTDLECLETVYAVFADNDQFELAELTHQYPEWLKHKRELKAGKSRVQMDYNDFFTDTGKSDPIFAQNKIDLGLARESFDEARDVAGFFAR